MHIEEKLLIGTVIAISGIMLIRSFEYTPNSRLFPQIAAILTILFGTLIVLNNRIQILSEDSTDIVDQVNKRSQLDKIQDKSTDENSDSKAMKIDAGEFRINQPVTTYRLPLINQPVTHRFTLTILLLVYLALIWLLGAFISSLIFLLLYAKIVNLKRNATIGLTIFVVSTLLVFGFWLETPIFRTGHGLFDGVWR